MRTRLPRRTEAPVVKGVPVPGALPPNPSNPDPIRYFRVEVSEVVKLAKLRGMSVFISATQFAPSRDQSNVEAEHTRGREVCGNIKVRKLELYRFLDCAYRERTRETCLVSIGVSTNCLFVGAG